MERSLEKIKGSKFRASPKKKFRSRIFPGNMSIHVSQLRRSEYSIKLFTVVFQVFTRAFV